MKSEDAEALALIVDSARNKYRALANAANLVNSNHMVRAIAEHVNAQIDAFAACLHAELSRAAE